MLLSYRRKRTYSRVNDVPLEDGITSSVFGPLRVMKGNDSWQLLSEALWGQSPENRPVGWPDCDAPAGARPVFSFWPRKKLFESSVEPDLLVDVGSDREKFRLIIEVKWESDESGKDQLLRQWLACTQEDRQPEENSFHVYLIKNARSSGSYAEPASDDSCEDARGWKGRLRILYWQDVYRNVWNMECRYKPQRDWRGDWAGDVRRFLDALGVQCFQGFDTIVSESRLMPAEVESWRIEHSFQWRKEPAMDSRVVLQLLGGWQLDRGGGMTKSFSETLVSAYQVISHVGMQVEALENEFFRELKALESGEKDFCFDVREAREAKAHDSSAWVRRVWIRNFAIYIKSRQKNAKYKEPGVMLALQTVIAPQDLECAADFEPYVALLASDGGEGQFVAGDYERELHSDLIRCKGDLKYFPESDQECYVELHEQSLFSIRTTSDVKELAGKAWRMVKHVHGMPREDRRAVFSDAE